MTDAIAHTPPDEDDIERALASANINALRIALYHQTRDPELARMHVNHVPVQGGALIAYSLGRADRAVVREKALAFLRDMATPKLDPTRGESVELMTLFTGDVPTPAEVDFGYDDLAFADFPREVRWTADRPAEALNELLVIIVGAGFSGIAAAIQLQRLGIPYRVIERLGGIGGTWELNDYPEARVDISTFLYQYKFVKRYPWKSHFAPRDELKEYLDFVVDTFGVRDNIELNTVVETAVWNDASHRWELRLLRADGTHESVAANVVFSCSGLFSTPNLPDIEGIDSFAGAMFHTTDWDHTFDWTGRDVALIGTGSTGSQLAPAIAQTARTLIIFQRTPNWVMPIHGYHDRVPEEHHWLLDNFPGYWNWFIYSNYIGSMQVQHLQTVDPEWQANGGRINEKNDALRARLTEFIRTETSDRPDLFDKLVPKYAPLGRRLVIDNGWYKTLVRDNVELVTTGIDRITPTGILDADGQQRDVDLIILSAGFQVSRYLFPINYTGRNGVTVEQAWAKDGARAYVSTTMPDFPNFFMFYGPTSGVRGGSFHSWIEVFTRYVCGLVVHMIEEGHAEVEVRRDVFENYNQAMDAQMPHLLWTLADGGKGYFYNEHGRVVTNMPWTTDEFYAFVRRADPHNYVFR